MGRPPGHGQARPRDLRRRKKTLPVLAALPADGPAARELAALLSTDPDDAAVRRAAELVEEAGGRAATLAEARHHLDAARAHLASVPPAPTAAAELLALLPFLVDRAL